MADRLGLKEAREIVDAMLKAAAERGLKFSAAVVDAGGDLIHLARMDGASALNARMSYNKAYTATKWQRDTKAIKERLFDMSLGDDRREVAWFGDPLYTPVWGGIALRSRDGTMLGAIGESGGTPAQDEEIGQLGARVFAGL
jgi:uncharacterized protein GlcG (DUF336 family)